MAVVAVCFLAGVAFLSVAATVVGGVGGVGGADTVVLLIAVVGGGRVGFRDVFLVGSGAFTTTNGFFRLAGALVVVVVFLVVVGTAVVVGFLLITNSVKLNQMRVKHLGTDKVLCWGGRGSVFCVVGGTFSGMEVDQFPLDLHWRWFDVAFSWWCSPVRKTIENQPTTLFFSAWARSSRNSSRVPGRVNNLVDDSGSGCGTWGSRG